MLDLRSWLSTMFLGVAILASRAAWSAAPPACVQHDFARKYPALANQTWRAAEQDSAPYVFRDGPEPGAPTGIDAEFARAAFACIGVDIELVSGVWSGPVADVVAGRSDVAWGGLHYTPERVKQVDYVTYMATAAGALVAKGNPRRLRSLDDVCGLRALAPLGSVEFTALKAQSAACRERGRPGIELVAFITPAAGEQLLDAQRADVLLTDLPVCSQIMRRPSSRFELAFSTTAKLPVGIAVKKGQHELELALRDAILLLQQDGVQRNLLVKYGLDPALQQPPEVIRE